jgi:hypothetical protein
VMAISVSTQAPDTKGVWPIILERSFIGLPEIGKENGV